MEPQSHRTLALPPGQGLILGPSWLKRAPLDGSRKNFLVLRDLFRELARERKRQVRTIERFAGDPSELQMLYAPLTHLAQVQCVIRALLSRPVEKELKTELRRLSDNALEGLRGTPSDSVATRTAYGKILGALLEAEYRVSASDPVPTNQRDEQVPSLSKFFVPTDLLRQIRCELFPAERMVVIAGRRAMKAATLGACFDVTGDAHSGHVRANANDLGAALIAMDLSDTFLAAWIHSHPGRGPHCTCPSPTDLKQHADWVKDYPLLLSAIMVEDGWVRFWGDAVQTGKVELKLLGTGVSQIREGFGDGCLYKLD